MTSSQRMIELATQIKSKSSTLENALHSDRDLLVLMEISLEISQISSRLRDEITLELLHYFKQGRRSGDRLSEPSD